MCGIVAIFASMMPEAELRQAALNAGKKCVPVSISFSLL
jgi:hypothetical protein